MVKSGDYYKNLVILGRMIEHNYQLAQYSDEATKSIVKTLEKAQNEFLNKIESQGVAAVSGRERQVLSEINDLMFGIQNRLVGDIYEAASIAGLASVDEHERILSFDGKLDDTVGFNHVAIAPQQLKSMIVDTPVGGALLADWVTDSFERNFVDDVKAEITTGMLKGDDTRALVKRLRQSADLTKQEAITLTRTYVADINNRAAGAVYRANSDIVKKEKWSAALEVGVGSGRTCIRCAVLDGREFPLEEPHIRPLAHPSCRCFMTPVTVSWRELGLDMDELKVMARPYVESNGKPIGTGGKKRILKAGTFQGKNFEDFLKSRSEGYQLSLLGPNRYRMWKRGEIKWDDMVDNHGNLVLLKKGKDGGYVGLEGIPTRKPVKPVFAPKSQGHKNLKTALQDAENMIKSRKTEKAYVFDLQGNEVLSKSGGKSNVGFTRAELDKMKGCVLTHNHPSGSSFSRADVKFCILYELKEIRAVTTENIFRFSIDKATAESSGLSAWSLVENKYYEKEKEIISYFDDKISKGELTAESARRQYHHKIWHKVNEEIAWINYRREKLLY